MEHLPAFVGPGCHQALVVARLELVAVQVDQLQIRDPVVADPGSEDLGTERERGERRVAAGAAAADRQPGGVHRAALHEEPGRGDAVLDVRDPPPATERVAVRPSVAGRAAIVHVHDGDPPGGEERSVERQGRGRRAGRPAVREHQERRQLAVGRAMGGVGRGEEERAGNRPVARGKGDRFGVWQHRRVQGDCQRPGEDPRRLGRRRVHAQDDAPVVWSGHDRHRHVAGHAQPLELRERRVELDNGPIGIDAEEMVGAVAARDGEDGAVGTEGIRRPPEDPGRIAKLGVHGRKIAGRAHDPVRAVECVEVPPARLVPDGVQDACRAPRCLGHADAGPPATVRAPPSDPSSSTSAILSRTASQGMSGRSHSIQTSVRPSGEGRAPATKSGPLTRTRPGPSVPSRANRNELVDHERRGVRVVGVVGLTDRVQARESGVEPEVRVAPRALRRDRHGLGDGIGDRIAVHPVQAAIGLRGHHHPLRRRRRTSRRRTRGRGCRP